MPTGFRNNLSCRLANTPGTSGDFTIASACPGFVRFVAADDGKTFSVVVQESADPASAKEVRTGCVYTHATNSLTRGTLESSTTGAALNLTAAAVVTNTVTAAEIGGVVSGAGINGVTAGAIGNSILRGQGSDSLCCSWFEFMCLAGGGHTIPLVNAGVNGDDNSQMRARFAADVLAQKPQVVFIACDAANSIQKAIGVQAAVTDVAAMGDAAKAQACRVVLCAASPFNTHPQVAQFNLAFRELSRKRGWEWVDPWAAMWSDGAWASGLSYDGLHPWGSTHYTAGVAAAAQFRAAVFEPMLPTVNADPAGLCQNALFSSSSDWTAAANTTLSLVAGTGGVLGNWLTFTTDTTNAWQVNNGSVLSLSGFASGGDTLRFITRIKTSGLVAAGGASLSTYPIQGNLGAYLLLNLSGGTGGTNPQLRQITMADASGILETTFTLPAGYTGVRPQLVVVKKLGAACVVSLAQMQVYNLSTAPTA